MSGGCWNYMNDSAASEILGYHIYVGYGLDSDKHEKNYKQVIRDNPLGDSKSQWFKKARKDRIKEMIDISTEKLKEDLYKAFGFETESSSEP